MEEGVVVDSSFSAVINAPLEKVDIGVVLRCRDLKTGAVLWDPANYPRNSSTGSRKERDQTN
jgi:hypothetical protein